MAEPEAAGLAGMPEPAADEWVRSGECYRLLAAELEAACWSFMARHLDRRRAVTLVRGRGVRPQAGDLVLARVVEIGRHRRLETVSGRRAELRVGDLLVLAYGARYAPDQFRGVVPDRLDPCHLLAAGGLAGWCVVRHEGVRAPTRIAPVGLLADAEGRVWNTRRLAPLAGRKLVEGSTPRPLTVVVAGTAMNAGKTTTACALIAGWKRLGLRVGAIKASGTASAGDRFAYRDAGADLALDPSDVGFPTTADMPLARQWEALLVLLTEAARQRMARLVVEVADGVLFEDSAWLVAELFAAGQADVLLLAAADAAGALMAVHWAQARGLPLAAVSGAVTRSPLAMEECARQLRVPLVAPADLEACCWMPDDVVARP